MRTISKIYLKYKEFEKKKKYIDKEYKMGKRHE